MMKLLQQNHVKYGLVLCGVLVVCLLIMELTGQRDSFDLKSPLMVAYQFIAPAVVWYLGLTAKKKLQKGKLTYKQGVVEGLKMSLVFGIVSPFIFLLYYLINPGILDYIKTAYQMPDAADNMVIVLDMVVQFFSALIFGTIYAAVISLFVKNRN